MPYFLKRQNFFNAFVAFNGGQVFNFIFCHELSLHCFFGSCFYTTSLFSIILDGVFIEFCAKVTENALVTKKLDLQLLIEVG